MSSIAVYEEEEFACIALFEEEGYIEAAAKLTALIIEQLPEDMRPPQPALTRGMQSQYDEQRSSLEEAVDALRELSPNHILIKIATLTTLEEFVAAVNSVA